MNRKPFHLLHVTPSFAPGGAQVRMVQLMNHFGSTCRHAIVSLDGDISAAAGLHAGIQACFPECRKTSNPIRMTAKLFDLMRTEQPDLVLTYNWGSMDAVTAAALRRIPAVHTEDGFGTEEADGQLRRRVWGRRLLLRHARWVVAPSKTLINIMTGIWRLPSWKVKQIPNGIDMEAFRPKPETYRREFSEPGELVVGTVGHLRPEKQQEKLIDICARLAVRYPVRLLIAGEGQQRERLETAARESGLGGKVRLLGHQKDNARMYWEMDVFALSSNTEQMPLSVLEAMASALPVISTDVGDIRNMVSRENCLQVVAGTEAYVEQLSMLLAGPELRKAIGAANRLHCERTFGLNQMVRMYWELYLSAMAKTTVQPIREVRVIE